MCKRLILGFSKGFGAMRSSSPWTGCSYLWMHGNNEKHIESFAKMDLSLADCCVDHDQFDVFHGSQPIAGVRPSSSLRPLHD